MKIVIFILAIIFSLSGEANVKLVKSEIKFSATGKPSFIKANGSVPLVETNLEFEANEVSGTAKVDLNKLDSGIELRDKHLKEKYLHTSKYPDAALLINKQKVNFGERNKLKAVLSFHGRKKEITLDAELEKNGKIVTLNSDFKFLLTDFGVKLPSFQGITAADKVKLNVVASFELQ